MLHFQFETCLEFKKTGLYSISTGLEAVTDIKSDIKEKNKMIQFYKYTRIQA